MEPKLHPIRLKIPMRIPGVLAARIVASAAVVGAVCAQGGQPTGSTSAPDPEVGTMLLEAKLGSFALEGHGRVEIKFRGTLLLHNFEGAPPIIEGDVRKEYEGHDRVVWFGRGRAVIEGKWRHLQWFGGDMEATWHGAGLARLYGEYDPATGRSGRVKVDTERTLEWQSAGSTQYVPISIHPGWPEIKRRRAAGLSDADGLPRHQPEPMRDDWFIRP